MIRWILLFFSLASMGLMFLGPSTGWVLFGVAGFLFGSIATALAFAQSRIETRARGEDLQPYQGMQRRPAPPEPPPSREAHGPMD